MKHTIRILMAFLGILCISEMQSQVGINTTAPANGAMLDVSSTNKGILIPRLNISNLGTIAPVTGGGTESLLVYNSNATTGKGFHYWNGSRWIPIDQDWKLIGNAGTDDESNFIGTTDNENFVFRTNDVERMRISGVNGQLLIGKTTEGSSSDLLQVVSDIEMGGGASRHDYNSENIEISAQSSQWNINVKNDSDEDDSTFYIGLSESESEAPIVLAPNGDVRLGKNDDDLPLDELHVVKDQDDDATTLRLDNTSTVNDIPHTAFELWDGSTYLKGFMRHNNKTNIMQIGHAEDNGIVEFFSGDGSGSNSDITMTLENDSSVTIEKLVNIKPGTAPTTPKIGDVYYDATANKLRVRTNVGWVNLH